MTLCFEAPDSLATFSTKASAPALSLIILLAPNSSASFIPTTRPFTNLCTIIPPATPAAKACAARTNSVEKLLIPLLTASLLILFGSSPLVSADIFLPTLTIVLKVKNATPTKAVNGTAIVFITLPTLINPGKDLKIENPSTPRILFNIPPRKPPNPFPFLFEIILNPKSCGLLFLPSSDFSRLNLLSLSFCCLNIPYLTFERTSFSFSKLSILTTSFLMRPIEVIVFSDKRAPSFLFGMSLFVSIIYITAPYVIHFSFGGLKKDMSSKELSKPSGSI